MAQLGRLGFLAIAVIFHLIYIYSIFDIYFVSPIVHGMQPHAITTAAPAKRLFLIVGDGLRADKCFQQHPDPFSNSSDPATIYLSPFVRSKVLNEGTFGVSHTRVPTESRPGHVAMIAGLYEDVSAVTTGWKLNPVNFDSVFNQSRHTWSWGSPDILPMFAEGATDGKVDAYTYGHEAEDFTGDSTQLDLWVFDRVEAFFDSAKKNETLKAMLHQDKIVFFLHLLGLDTAGHGYRPYSKEYLRNIKVVDDGVERINRIVNDFYQHDDQTAWVFTADHGMSDWGSHGDGHPDNTRTPLVTWGPGIRRPVTTAHGEGLASGHDELSSDWGFDHVRRVDVAQADIAALMAYLVGINYPVNSVGELPLEYLDAPDEVKAKALLTNARQILEQYKVKESHKIVTKIKFKPFPLLSDETASLESRFSLIEALITQEDYDEAIRTTLELMKIGLEGLRYLQTYDWLFLRTLVTLGYLGWIAFALTSAVTLHVLQQKMERINEPATTVFFVSILVAIWSVIYIEQSSWRYYVYAFFPVYFWEEVFLSRSRIAAGAKVLFAHVNTPLGYIGLTLKAVVFVAIAEAIVMGYFYREIFTACFLLATIWPLSHGIRFIKTHLSATTLWVVCCCLMSTFTLLPVVKVEDENSILLGGALMVVIGLGYMYYGNRILDPSCKTLPDDEYDWVSKCIMGVQVGLIVLSMWVTRSSMHVLKAKEGLPLGNQVVGWAVLVLSLLMPFIHGTVRPQGHYGHRLMIIFLAFAPIFVLLTISYEGLFYVMFSIALVVWVTMERLVYEQTLTKRPETKPSTSASNGKEKNIYRAINLGDVRISLFFFFLIQIAFFGTGNIASISSFSLDSVTRLLPIFEPFSMTALLMFKILIPFVIISANLGILNRRIGPLAPSSLFMLVISVADILTLNFFWMVKDEGSWLDIGTTISHYCIGAGLVVFVSALEAVSEIVVGGVRFDEDGGQRGVEGKGAREGELGKQVKVDGSVVGSKN